MYRVLFILDRGFIEAYAEDRSFVPHLRRDAEAVHGDVRRAIVTTVGSSEAPFTAHEQAAIDSGKRRLDTFRRLSFAA